MAVIKDFSTNYMKAPTPPTPFCGFSLIYFNNFGFNILKVILKNALPIRKIIRSLLNKTLHFVKTDIYSKK